MNKEFLPYDTVRDNGIRLAYQIYKEGFVPDIIYVSLRGGAYIGNVISEFFKVVRRGQRPCFYAAVVARSYTDIRQNDKVMVDGWTYSPEHLRTGDKILLVDDIFDSGKTLNYLAEIIISKGIPREDLKVAVHDYKVFEYLPDHVNQPIHPDYYCRKHIIRSPLEDVWIHYMSHELIGLTLTEEEEHYDKCDPLLHDALRSILS
ncbi:MAG: phosphoribosyltransferase [Spirochaetales bacterium]|nr:phosphoribosyltransferase [Spirochaetales bacterium]